MTTRPVWPPDWLRGVLEVCVLRVLADGPTYGYAIATRLSEAGLGTLKGGTLYPLLTRFESAGLVAVEWRAGEGGPGRKYYALTDDGRRVWREQASRWAAFARLTTELVTPDAADDGPAVIAPPSTRPTARTTAGTTVGPDQVRNGARP